MTLQRGGACQREGRARRSARVEENVTVVGDSALVVQTQSPSIATNLTGTQITSLPLTSRNALDSLTSLPGFSTSGTARNSIGERPAAKLDQHHARRHEHPGQLPEDDRRLLRASERRCSTRSKKSP